MNSLHARVPGGSTGPETATGSDRLRYFGAYGQLRRHGRVSTATSEYLSDWSFRAAAGERHLVVGRESTGGARSWMTIELPDFDCRILGRSIARVRDVFCRGAADSPPEIAGYIRDAAEYLRGLDVDILMVDAWNSDAPLETACIEAGLVPGATRLRWIRPGMPGRAAGPLRGRHVVRAARASDLKHLLPLAAQFGPGQYAGVCGIGAEMTALYYSRWMEEAWRGSFADDVLVAENSAGPCAFASFKLRRDLLQATGRRIMGGGLAAVARGSEGALIALMCAMMARVDAGDYDGVEFDMYDGNDAAERCLRAFDFRHVDTARVMHWCLESRATARGGG